VFHGEGRNSVQLAAVSLLNCREYIHARGAQSVHDRVGLSFI